MGESGDVLHIPEGRASLDLESVRGRCPLPVEEELERFVVREHGGKVVAGIGNLPIDRRELLLHELTLRPLVVPAEILGHGKREGPAIAFDFPFPGVDQGADELDFGILEIHLRLEGRHSSAIGHVQEEGLDRVVHMVGEGHLGKAEPPGCLVDDGLPHPRADGAGEEPRLLVAMLLEHGIDFLLLDQDVGDGEGTDVFFDLAEIDGRKAEVQVHGDQFEILVPKLPVEGKKIQKDHRILAPGETEEDLVPTLEEAEVVVGLPQRGEHLLPKRVVAVHSR